MTPILLSSRSRGSARLRGPASERDPPILAEAAVPTWTHTSPTSPLPFAFTHTQHTDTWTSRTLDTISYTCARARIEADRSPRQSVSRNRFPIVISLSPSLSLSTAVVDSPRDDALQSLRSSLFLSLSFPQYPARGLGKEVTNTSLQSLASILCWLCRALLWRARMRSPASYGVIDLYLYRREFYTVLY